MPAQLAFLAFLAVYLLSVGHVFAQPPADGDRAREPVKIRVAEGEWGNVRRADIERVLTSVAGELGVFFPGGGDTIMIKHTSRAPKVLDDRGANGEYVVLLTASGRRWAEYAYEFAHEFCHIHANHGLRGDMASTAHQWFEESLCEVASLFVLRRMAARWSTDPPHPAWREYAPAFAEYAQALLEEPHRRGSKDLGPWYAERAAKLALDPYSREDNEYCANRLLGLFESQPEGWKALRYLNFQLALDPSSFSGYLRGWHDAAPLGQRPFLAKLLAQFGVLPGPQRVAAAQ